MRIFISSKNRLFKWLVTQVVLVTFLISMIVPIPFVQAQSVLNLPTPGTLITASPTYKPSIIKGITLHPSDPFLFDFIVHPGDDNLQGDELQKESMKLIKYFMAALTVPEDEMWVNLSPYEKDRIIPQGFGDTAMGRDLLAQDYILKQLTSSLMFTENRLGGEFWSRVYTKAQEKYGTTEIPMNTFNKVWIVPEKAVIYENGTSAFIVESHLKVMLEEDYLALESNIGTDKHGLGDITENDLKKISGISSVVVREIIIPEIEREVNEGENFANLRQITNSVILATWYKQNVQGSILEQIYINQNKTEGVDTEDKEINQKIYNQYVAAFEKGVYDFIKEDYDHVHQKVISRKYFSGGAEEDWRGKIEKSNDAAQLGEDLNGSSRVRMQIDAALLKDSTMITNPKKIAVIGASGRLGGQVYENLQKRGHQVVGTSFRATDFSRGLIQLDVRNQSDIDEFIEGGNFDVVIYAPGVLHINDRNREIAQEVNINAIDYFAKTFKGHFVFLSSSGVFNGGSKGQYKIDDDRVAGDEYAEQKIGGEDKVISNKSNFGKVSIVRLGKMYGEVKDEARSEFVRDIINSLKEKKPITVDNTLKRYPSHFEDMNNLVNGIIENEKVENDIIHLGSDRGVTPYEWALLIAEQYYDIYGGEAELGLSLDDLKALIQKKEDKTSSSEPKLVQNVSYFIPVSLEDGIKRTVENYKDSDGVRIVKRDKKILLTAPPRTGKSTAIQKLVERLKGDGQKVVGFYTREIIGTRPNGSTDRVGFEMVSVADPENKVVIAHGNDLVEENARDSENYPKLGSYYIVDLGKIRTFVESLSSEASEADVIIIDEIGKMQLFSDRFREVIEEVFSSDATVIATVPFGDNTTDFVEDLKVRQDTEVVEITVQNRDNIVEEIVDKISTQDAIVASHVNQVQAINTAISEDNKTNGVEWDYWAEDRERDDERIKRAIEQRFKGSPNVQDGLIEFAYEGDQVVAYVMYKETDNPDQMSLSLLAAHPGFRGKYAQDLMQKVLEEAIKANKKEVILNVFTINTRGINFYRRTVPRELGRLISETNEKLLDKRVSKVTGGEKQVIQFTYSLNNTKGGIDLNPDNINIQTSGEKIQFQFPSNVEINQLNNSNAFTPVIINISPVTNIPLLIGKENDMNGGQELISSL